MSAAWVDHKVMTFQGAYDTRKGTERDYSTITLGEVFSLEPSALPKDRALAMIPSSYCGPDARAHEQQRQHGRYVAVCLDVDEGSPAFEDVCAVVDAFFGPDVASLVYSSSRSSQDLQKWRAVVPLDEPLCFEDWCLLTESFYDFVETQDLTVDHSLSEPGQPVYLPNVPQERRSSDGKPLFYRTRIAEGRGACTNDPLLALWVDRRRRREQADADAKAAGHAVAQAARQARGAGGSDVIQQFNAMNSIGALMIDYGYEESPRGRDDWRSPYQTSDSYATRVFTSPDGEQSWVSLSDSDSRAGLGAASPKGHRYGDAFDLHVHFDHGGDFNAAVREASQEGYLMDPVETMEMPPAPDALPAMPEPFPGPMAGIVEAALDSAFKPQPSLTTLAVLIGMAAACHGKYRLPSGTRLNLYGVGVAQTGAGKDTPRHVAVEVARQAGAAIIGAAGSGQGLEDSLVDGKGTLSEMDEIAHVLAAVNASTAPIYMKALSGILLKLYSAGRGHYPCRVLAGKSPRSVANPCFSFIGFATPQTLGESLKLGNITDGLIGRMLFAFGLDDVPPRRSPRSFMLPGAAKDVASSFTFSNFPNIANPDALDVTITPEADQLLGSIMLDLDARMQAQESALSKALLARAFEKVERIAGVLAVWDCTVRPVIDVRHAQWALRAVEASDAAVLHFVGEHLHSSKTHADAALVLRCVIDAMNKKLAPRKDRMVEADLLTQGLAPRSLVLRSSKLDKREFDLAVEHLVATGEVEAAQVPMNSASAGRSRPVGVLYVPSSG